MDSTSGATKQENFKRDIKLEIKFSKIIKSILGNQFIVKDAINDLEQGTDFLIMQANPFRIAVRLRRFKFYKIYPNDFTIRWERPSGVKTEIHKINDGLVDYFLYGFCNEFETKIIKYFIADLKVFRLLNIKPKAIKPNNPFDSWLAVYSIFQFPKEFFLKKYP